MSWLEEKWKWILGVLALIGAMIITFLSSRKRTQALPVSTEAEAEKLKVEKASGEEAKAAEISKTWKITAIKQEHAEVIQKLDESQKKRYEELQEDPEALTNWLMDVGSNVRGRQ